MNPAWTQIALAEQGQAEKPGASHNPRILEYHATTGLKAKEDEVPWCASFVGWCLEQAGLKSTGSASARSYESWGVPLSVPVLGAVIVGTRPGGGHVGFYMGQHNGRWLLINGNVSNKVTVSPFDPNLVTAIRWPADVPLPNSVAPLSKSGVMQGNMLAAAGTIGSIGVALIDNAETVDRAKSWIDQGTIVAVALGALILGGVIWSTISRARGKKQEAGSQ